jgi:uncharacterized alpha-E superfamily protein
MLDARGAQSVAFNLTALAQTAQNMRERLSSDHARMMNDVQSRFRDAVAAQARAGSISDDDALEFLTELILHLAAITGAQTDRMTRDDGWRLLTVGRQLERLLLLTATLNLLFKRPADLTEERFDLLLELFDSTITYRARHQRWQHPAPLIDLLVLEQANPRALACTVRKIRDALVRLPEPHGSELAAQLVSPAAWPGLAALSAPGPDGGLPVLGELLRTLDESGARLSNTIGARLFSHAEPRYKALQR